MAYLNLSNTSNRKLARLIKPHSLRLMRVALKRVLFIRIMLSLRKIDYLKVQIQKTQDKQNAKATGADLADIREVAWSVSSASRCVPRATCLTQALAGAWLMAERGWQAEVSLTVPTSSKSGFAPHAWLLHGNTIILGGTPEEFYQHSQFGQQAERN